MRDELLEHLNNHGRNKNYYDSDYASDLPDYIYDTRYLRNVTFTNSTVKVFFFFLFSLFLVMFSTADILSCFSFLFLIATVTMCLMISTGPVF